MIKRRKGYRGERELVNRIKEVYDPAWIERLAVSGIGGAFPDIEFVKQGCNIGIEVKRTKKKAVTFSNRKKQQDYISTVKWAKQRRKEEIYAVPLLAWRPDYHTDWHFYKILGRPDKLRVKLSNGFLIGNLSKLWTTETTTL